jgi:hypothetical protein
MTNYRLRDFDFEFDVDEVLEYESPRSSPYMPTPVRKESYVLITGFQARMTGTPRETFDNILLRIAHLLVASQRINRPMAEVALMGYPDAPGTDQNTMNLAFNRAADVRTKLQALMTRIAPGSADRVKFSIYVNNAAGAGHTKAVDVRLPTTCQAFFADFDQQSFNHAILGIDANPAITNKLQRSNNRLFVGQELDARLNIRAAKALAGEIMPRQVKHLSIDDRATIRKGVDDLSKMQLDLFKKYHPESSGFSPDSLMACMLQFANGQLRSPHPDFDQGANRNRESFGVGEPDSYHVFMFAEFALLCIDWEIPEAASWARALPAMVAAQEVFMHVYRRNPKPRAPEFDSALPTTFPARRTHPLTDFRAKHFVQTGSQISGEGQSSADRLARVAEKYKGMPGPEQLRAAMTSNLLRAQTLT